jgi:choline-glycine betaine transporter
MEPIQLVNQPMHFFAALYVIVLFVFVVFYKNEKISEFSHHILYVWYAIIILTGIFIVSTIPFSVFVLLKAVSGLCLIALAEMIIQGKNSKLIWTFLLITAACGLGIAYFLI